MMSPLKPRWPNIIWKPCADRSGPRILGINPWVYDFAAYNLWSRPSGLLTCLDMFSRSGARTSLLDLMDQSWQDQDWPRPKKLGSGHYPKVSLPRPKVLENVPRQYSRYGLPRERAARAVACIDPPPDLILITSIMTYWYPGIFSVIELLRRTWPDAPLCLGGIYPTLCPEHAQNMDVDLVISGPLETEDNWKAVWKLIGCSPPELPEGAGFRMDTSFYKEQPFSIIQGSRGCPFKCSYCAGHKLYPGFRQADPDMLFEHVRKEYGKGVRDFAFYDDALLSGAENMFIPLAEKIIRKGLRVRLHTPNALHVRYLTIELCRLLYRAGLHSVRLGFETSEPARLDEKLTPFMWRAGMRNLLQAGFNPKNIAAYVLFGLPGQSSRKLKQSIKEVLGWGITPMLTQYSPIPGSALFEKAREHAWLKLDDPLAHNNSIWPCVPGGFSWKKREKWNILASGNL